jgi:chitin disaccharide deacetylase
MCSVNDVITQPPTGRRLSALILNADDWGRDRETTDRTLECLERRAISSVSAMVFMADSERAAEMAKSRDIDAGLHLNLTAPFTGSRQIQELSIHHQRVRSYLRGHRLAQVVFHPGLARSFEYVVKAQLDEYLRLFGSAPERIDGHHHMHLCANVLYGRLLPVGTQARRSFSFLPGEKSALNRAYRRIVDKTLMRRHRTTDFFYSLPPLGVPGRLERILSLAKSNVVEVENHPANTEEYRFLGEGEIFRYLTGGLSIASKFLVLAR